MLATMQFCVRGQTTHNKPRPCCTDTQHASFHHPKCQPLIMKLSCTKSLHTPYPGNSIHGFSHSQPPTMDFDAQHLHCTLRGERLVDSCPSLFSFLPLFSHSHALAHPPEVEGCLWLSEFACISLLHLFVAIAVVITAALTVLVILAVAVIVGAFLLHRLLAVTALQE